MSFIEEQEGLEELENSFYNDSVNSSSSDNLNEAESNNDSSLYNPEQTDPKSKNKLKTIVKKLTKSKVLLFGVSGGSILIIIMIVALIIFMGTLKIPNLMQNIENYQFAKVSENFSTSAADITDESLAVAAEKGVVGRVYQSLKAKFDGTVSGASSAFTSLRNSTWGKLDKYRPSKIIDNITQNHNIEIQYSKSGEFTGFLLNGEEHAIAPVTGLARWVPGVKQFIANGNRNQVADELINTIMSAEEVNKLGTITTGAMYKFLVGETGGSLGGYILRNFLKKEPKMTQAESNAANVASETLDVTNSAESVANNDIVPLIEDGTSVSKRIYQSVANSPAKILEAIKNNGVYANASQKITQALHLNGVKKALSDISPVYNVIMPLCIIYDASVVNSGPAIANQMAEQQNVFDQYSAYASQQQAGSINNKYNTALNNAVSGGNQLLGNISASNAIERASGQTINTSNIPSVEAGGGGSYSHNLLTALNIPGGSTLGPILNGGCKVLTSTGFTVAFVLANFAVGALTGGGSEVVTEGTTVAVEAAVEEVTTTSAEAAAQEATGATIGTTTDAATASGSNTILKTAASDVLKNGSKSNVSRAYHFIKTAVIQGGAIFGLSFLAHMLVAAKSGSANNGLATGNNLSNEIDSGANIQANQVERTQLFGAPLTSASIGQQIQYTNKTIAYNNSKKSLANRLFSLSNANSLISYIGITLSGFFSKSMFTDIISFCSSILQPFKYMGDLFSIGGAAQAAVSPINQNYGNVQFGWTNSEDSLINSSSSYLPLENAQILSSHFNEEQTIAQTYSSCFGYKYNPNGDGHFDPLDKNGFLIPDSSGIQSGSIAGLLVKNNIQRDSSGNILPSGYLCSPQNLGPNNPQFGSMVFRWRLAMRYDTTLDTLTNLQTVN